MTIKMIEDIKWPEDIIDVYPVEALIEKLNEVIRVVNRLAGPGEEPS